MTAIDPQDVVRAAGTLPWRRRGDDLEVALVHRPRYDDWSWPKGKLDVDEPWPVAAVRETEEETGLRVRLGLPLPQSRYVLESRTPPEDKVVRYWAAQVVGGSGELENEVDGVEWLPPERARERLTYERDRDQLDALLGAHAAGTLDALPFGVVRHAKAVPRKAWSRDDWLRPLDKRGYRQAAALPGLFGAYAFEHVLSSSSTRCVETVEPYAADSGIEVDTSRRLSEEAYEKGPGRSLARFEKALDAGPETATVVCSHGPLLPALVELLTHRAAGAALALLGRAVGENLDKGELLVAYLVRGHDGIRVVDAERHAPLL